VAVSLPTHSSWLTQNELHFLIVQREALAPTEVTNEAVLRKRPLDFQAYYQERARPFSCSFTAADLKERLDALKDFGPT
jgi:hypothetical protein